MPIPASSDPRDTAVLPGSPGWQDTAVLLPTAPASVPPGWYADPYDPAGVRYWDGRNWTNHYWDPRTLAVQGAPGPAPRPRRRRSVLLAFVLAILFGGLALPYALPLPWWARLGITVLIVILLNWWLLLLVPLSWPFALILVPALTALMNPRRIR